MFKQFTPTDPPKIAPKYVDSSSEEEGEEEPHPEPILQARRLAICNCRYTFRCRYQRKSQDKRHYRHVCIRKGQWPG